MAPLYALHLLSQAAAEGPTHRVDLVIDALMEHFPDAVATEADRQDLLSRLPSGARSVVRQRMSRLFAFSHPADLPTRAQAA